MARVLGIRANTVVASAFALSGVLAAVAAILLTAQTGTVSPTIGVSIVLFAFIATIVGGMGSLSGAVLGGFSIGALTVALQASLPLDLTAVSRRIRVRRRARVLIVRPQGLLPARVDPRARGPAAGRRARRRPAARSTCWAPATARKAVAQAPERGRRSPVRLL